MLPVHPLKLVSLTRVSRVMYIYRWLQEIILFRCLAVAASGPSTSRLKPRKDSNDSSKNVVIKATTAPTRIEIKICLMWDFFNILSLSY